MYCLPIKKKDCKTFEDHAHRLADIYMDCNAIMVLDMECIKICQENNFNYEDMKYRVSQIITELN